MNNIKIKYFTGAEEICKIENGDWIDLRASEDVLMKKCDFTMIPLGVAMELPHGYEAIIVPRSSTFKKWGIIMTNSVGVIDESYCGDNDQWMMPVYATRNVTIHRGDRICQFRLLKHQEPVEFKKVDSLGNADRGGFGSTGTR